MVRKGVFERVKGGEVQGGEEEFEMVDYAPARFDASLRDDR
jgi:hypothetical protein